MDGFCFQLFKSCWLSSNAFQGGSFHILSDYGNLVVLQFPGGRTKALEVKDEARAKGFFGHKIRSYWGGGGERTLAKTDAQYLQLG